MTDNGVRDNQEAHRFELERNGEVAFLDYQRSPGEIAMIHTEVPPALRGQGVGTELIAGALAQAQREGLRIVAVCQFVRAYLKKHPLQT